MSIHSGAALPAPKSSPAQSEHTSQEPLASRNCKWTHMEEIGCLVSPATPPMMNFPARPAQAHPEQGDLEWTHKQGISPLKGSTMHSSVFPALEGYTQKTLLRSGADVKQGMCSVRQGGRSVLARPKGAKACNLMAITDMMLTQDLPRPFCFQFCIKLISRTAGKEGHSINHK